MLDVARVDAAEQGFGDQTHGLRVRSADGRTTRPIRRDVHAAGIKRLDREPRARAPGSRS